MRLLFKGHFKALKYLLSAVYGLDCGTKPWNGTMDHGIEYQCTMECVLMEQGGKWTMEWNSVKCGLNCDMQSCFYLKQVLENYTGMLREGGGEENDIDIQPPSSPVLSTQMYGKMYL